MTRNSLYPRGPAGVPEDLTRPSSAFRTQATLVLLALGMFFLLYFGLMLLCLAYSLWAIFLCPRHARLFAIILAGPPLLLFIYMLKNLFKYERARKEFLIEIFDDEHPRLFDFIERVCDETGAPFPTHVYVDYSVNAAARPDSTSFVRLFLPTGKSLLIGLGLVNAVNLTEFKAMLAHEFGHFSQRSMRIGAYVYTSLRIYQQMIYGEDFFDRLIRNWSEQDIRIAWPAHILRGIFWLLRGVLGLLACVVHYFHMALSRQMELNADLVAVSVAGSDAPVHLLCRCGFADASFQQAVNDLRVALDNHIYTSDLFHHQTAAMPYLRKIKKDSQLGEPPPLPDDPDETTDVFEENDDHIAEMWQTHPSNFDRERNAKERYFRTEFDERSAWLLFDREDELRKRVTFKFYRFHFKIPKDVVLAEPEEVQGFIDEEHADRTYDPRYQGLYDNRNILVTDLRERAREGAQRPWSVAKLAQAHATLYSGEVWRRSQLYYKRLQEMFTLQAVRDGWERPRNGELRFRDEVYDPEDAADLLKKVDRELKKDHAWLAEIDHKVFSTYFQMALHLEPGLAEELYRRYDFHLALQRIWRELQEHSRPIQSAIGFLNTLASGPGSSTRQVRRQDFEALLETFREVHQAMNRMLHSADEMVLPALKNLPAGKPVRAFLLEKGLVDGLSRYKRRLSERWIVKLLGQFSEMKAKVDRIHFKSLAGILALQEKIGAECMARWLTLPTVTPAPR